jgi:2-polyprenyl-3-methyl-5-hydroxy-6-metoxy-1,4-benzoquinol methylase
MRDAFNKFSDKIDVLTSFDVIEHVSDPQEFTNDIFNLTSEGGQIIVGTPGEYRHLREMVGSDFDSFIFSIQHPWVFAEKGLTTLFEKAGFKNVKIKQFANYGLGNVFAWLKEKTPKGNITYPCISETINEAWKSNLAERGYGDYLVVYATK